MDNMIIISIDYGSLRAEQGINISCDKFYQESRTGRIELPALLAIIMC